jgi:hypothetical protein
MSDCVSECVNVIDTVEGAETRANEAIGKSPERSMNRGRAM